MFLFSIKPKYVKEIEKKVKRYEFRRYISKKCKKEIENNYIAVYESFPIKAVTLILKIGTIYEKSVHSLWRDFNKKAGISKINFFKYFKNKNSGFALEIKRVVKLKKAINLEDIQKSYRGFHAPQNYRELKYKFPTLNSRLNTLKKKRY